MILFIWLSHALETVQVQGNVLYVGNRLVQQHSQITLAHVYHSICDRIRGACKLQVRLHIQVAFWLTLPIRLNFRDDLDPALGHISRLTTLFNGCLTVFF